MLSDRGREGCHHTLAVNEGVVLGGAFTLRGNNDERFAGKHETSVIGRLKAGRGGCVKCRRGVDDGGGTPHLRYWRQLRTGALCV